MDSTDNDVMQELGEHLALAGVKRPLEVIVVPHEDGGGYFVYYRVYLNPRLKGQHGWRAQGAGLHLMAAGVLAADIRDGKLVW